MSSLRSFKSRRIYDTSWKPTSPSKFQTNITDFISRGKPSELIDVKENSELPKPTDKVLPQKQSNILSSSANEHFNLDFFDDDDDNDFIPIIPKKNLRSSGSFGGNLNKNDNLVSQNTVQLTSPIQKQLNSSASKSPIKQKTDNKLFRLNKVYNFTPESFNNNSKERNDVGDLPKCSSFSNVINKKAPLDLIAYDGDEDCVPAHVSETKRIANFESDSDESICLFENDTVKAGCIPETVKLTFDLEIDDSIPKYDQPAADDFDQQDGSLSPILSRSPDKTLKIESLASDLIDSKIADIKSELNIDEFLTEIRAETDVSTSHFRTETSVEKLKRLEYEIMRKICDIVRLAENIDRISVMDFCKSTNINELQAIRHMLMLKQLQLASTSHLTVNKPIGSVPLSLQPLSPVNLRSSPLIKKDISNETEADILTEVSHSSSTELSSATNKRFKFTPINQVLLKLQSTSNTKCNNENRTDLMVEDSKYSCLCDGMSQHSTDFKIPINGGSKNEEKFRAMPIETQDNFVCDSVFDHIDLNEIETKYHMNRSNEFSFTIESSLTSLNESFLSTSVKPNIQKSPVMTNIQGNHKNDGFDPALKKLNYPHSEEMLNIFHAVFGLKEFRTNQLAALCSLDIPAAHLSGDITVTESDRVYERLFMKGSGIKLLYVTPEKIGASGKFLNVLETLYQRCEISRFVIDEVHCVSQWGHDFRPDYKKLHILREKFPQVPLMALTATATPRVRNDILHQLKIPSPKWFLQSFNRTNLCYSVKPKKGKSLSKELIMLIKQKYSRQSGIVYCLSRNECDTVSEEFTKAGLSAVAYHAGLNDKNRIDAQEKWLNDKVKIVCATIAFGMGIDKPDVRFVFHYTLPKSIEGYYQESGRAGRDYLAADCILFYSYQDVLRHRKLIEMDKNGGTFSARKIHYDNLYRIVAYCENKTDCRRAQQLEYFGERFDSQLCRNSSQTCDNCLSKESYVQHDATQDAVAIMKCVESIVKNSRARFTLIHFIDVFKGSNSQKIIAAGHNKLPLHGKGESYNRTDAERLMRKLVLNHYLQEELVTTANDHTVAYIQMGRRAAELLSGKDKVFLPMQHVKRATLLPVPTGSNSVDTSSLQSRCYEELLEECKRIAAANGLYYSNVMNMAALREMSINMPITEEEMLKIPHVTKANFDKFGHAFLAITIKYATEQQLTDVKDIADFDETFRSESEDSPYFASASKPKRKSNWATYGYKRSRKTKATSSSSQTGATSGKSNWITRRKSSKTKSKAVTERNAKAKSSNLGAMPFP
ncbi:hypothetical protein CHUAL_009024 [Chamberlinius hualienensis]